MFARLRGCIQPAIVNRDVEVKSPPFATFCLRDLVKSVDIFSIGPVVVAQ